MADVPGERTIQEAGCVLTWRTFFPDVPEPRAVVYIGDRDIWRHAHAETRPFGEGLYQLDLNPARDEVWGPLLDDQSDMVDGLIQDGRILYDARIREIQRALDTYAFEIEFEGHRTLAVNDRGSGEMGEAMRQRGFDIGYCYAESVRSGRRQTFVTLYSSSVDVSIIARKFGGGGHRGAAGFAFVRAGEPFPGGASVRQPGH